MDHLLSCTSKLIGVAGSVKFNKLPQEHTNYRIHHGGQKHREFQADTSSPRDSGSRIKRLYPNCLLLQSLCSHHMLLVDFGCFPKKFCDMHLPKHDDTVVLVDESEQEFETKYLVDKNGLSGGWRGFSIAHKLLEKDVLVFQLIAPCKFKGKSVEDDK